MKPFTEDFLETIHSYSTNNAQWINDSETAGCFYCKCIFPTQSITRWIDDLNGPTALCPHCNMDSVLPGSKVDLTEDLLKAMYQFWFHLEKH